MGENWDPGCTTQGLQWVEQLKLSCKHKKQSRPFFSCSVFSVRELAQEKMKKVHSYFLSWKNAFPLKRLIFKSANKNSRGFLLLNVASQVEEERKKNVVVTKGGKHNIWVNRCQSFEVRSVFWVNLEFTHPNNSTEKNTRKEFRRVEESSR